VRLDEIFSTHDSFAGIYTVDDGQAHSPTINPYSFDDVSLRSQVARALVPIGAREAAIPF